MIGYMAVGKTTIGKQLSRALSLDFVDLDQLVEKNSRKSIPEIFDSEGEASFRGAEKKALHQTFELENVLVSTGGGTPCFYDNMMQMNEHGTTIYLQMDPASIAYRLKHAKNERPLVEGKSLEELRDFVKSHLEERSNYYEEAHIHFSSLGFNAKKMEQLQSLINQTK